MESLNKKLEKVAQKYSAMQFNADNYNVGGGLVDYKYASNRHENAKQDQGKLTLGQATSLFKKATDLELHEIKEIITFVYPNLEWHHAGFLPKNYGGGMKKTYFVNANQILDLAQNWYNYIEKYNAHLEEKKSNEILQIERSHKKSEFLKENAKRFDRVLYSQIPEFSKITAEEMNGKYGWFDAKSQYNMTIYYSGYAFESKEKENEYNLI